MRGLRGFPAPMAIALAMALIASACMAAPEGPEPLIGEPDTSFLAAQPVEIAGYEGDAMEPFLSRDGAILFFNNRNDPGERTDVHWAQRELPDRFVYRGTVEGAALPGVLDGVPSMSAAGEFVFTSLRGVDDKRTIWRGIFAQGSLTQVGPVEGDVNAVRPFWVNMDSEISADGQTLYTTDSRFDPIRGMIVESNLVIAQRTPTGFERVMDSAAQLAKINSKKMEYAAALTRDLKTLYFTRVDFDILGQGGEVGFQTLVSRRASVTQPWGLPRPVASISGYAEAPTLSPDECSLYFHKRVRDRFAVFRTTRRDCGGED